MFKFLGQVALARNENLLTGSVVHTEKTLSCGVCLMPEQSGDIAGVVIIRADRIGPCREISVVLHKSHPALQIEDLFAPAAALVQIDIKGFKYTPVT